MKITLDGKSIEVKDRKTILEIARDNDVFIPSLCDHSQLKPFSGCRLCLVEIKGSKGYIPSCSVYPEEGMEIITDTPGLKKIKRKILELILAEHPSACLICQEKNNCDDYKSTIRKVGETTGCVLCANNGQCELQDVVESLSVKSISYPALYRDIDVHKTDPFFDRDYNLCILCGRCVRVCQELRGASAVTFTYRGSEAVIGTVLDKPLKDAGCQFCGACLDVCPTGAIAERAVRYEGQPDERKKTICPLCSSGCELTVSLKEGRILSTQPSSEGIVNRGQGCVRGRFVLRDANRSKGRISSPMIRKNKDLEKVDWKEALDFVAQKLNGYKGKEIGFVVTPQASCDDLYVLQRFSREVLKTENITTSFSSCLPSAIMRTAENGSGQLRLNYRLQDISSADTIFLINEDPAVTQPMIWIEVLKAVRQGARLIVISPKPVIADRFADLVLRINPGTECFVFYFLCKFLLDSSTGLESIDIQGIDKIKKSLESLEMEEVLEQTGLDDASGLKKAAGCLLSAESSALLFGWGSAVGETGEASIASLRNLSLLTGAQLYPLFLESNLRGFHAVWDESGKETESFVGSLSRGKIKALYLAGPAVLPQNVQPEFLVYQDTHLSRGAELADAVLPALTSLERDGLFVNTEGRIQKYRAVTDPESQGKADWWILSQLAKRLGGQKFSYRTSQSVIKEMAVAIPAFSALGPAAKKKKAELFLAEGESQKEQMILLDDLQTPPAPDEEFPLLLVADYGLDYYRSCVLADENRGLELIRDPHRITLSRHDADRSGIKEGDKVQVISPKGSIRRLARISDSFPPGIAAAEMTWSWTGDLNLINILLAPGEESRFCLPIPVRLERGE